MPEIDSHPLLVTDTVAVWDVLCSGTCRHKSAEECVSATHLVFPYRGVYVRHLNQVETVAEANQVVFFNEHEPYRVSHPVGGGDASLSLEIDEQTLLELVPADVLHAKDRALFNRPRMRIDARAQFLSALVRHRLAHGTTETLEAEDLIISLVGRAVGERTSYAASGSVGRQKLVDRAKLVLSSDIGRRWTLAEIGSAVGVYAGVPASRGSAALPLSTPIAARPRA
jgi:AraC family transcriptional regulator